MSCYCGNVLRRKTFHSASDITETKLARVLNTGDLVLLGIGCTLGSGVYVVSGQVARNIAGPAVVISFFIAAVASILAGLCYAEFGSRVPKAGSAYIYSYVTVGELWAFVIGWNLILEYVIGSASVARGFSAYVDDLIHHKMSIYLMEHTPLHVPTLSPYPDFLAFGIAILVTVLLCIGVKESSILNNVFTLINLSVIAFVIICGAIKADISNWSIPADQVPTTNATNFGTGGFLPYGSTGILAGAATCFYAFVGFDVIASTGEEAKNPQKSMPLSIVLSLVCVTLAYCGVSIVLTLVVPYYQLDPLAPLPGIFEDIGWTAAKYVVSVGAIAGLSTSLLGCMLPLPRIIYAMAKDGLLFRFLSHVTDRFKTPTLATLIGGLFSAIMAMLFDIVHLVEMMSIGTLLAYTLVSTCVLLLRYEVPILPADIDLASKAVVSSDEPADGNDSTEEPNKSKQIGLCGALFTPKDALPTNKTSGIVKICVLFLVIFLILISVVQQQLLKRVPLESWMAIVCLAVPAAGIILVLVIIVRQPQNAAALPFKAPLVPLVPAASMFLNIYLMMELSRLTWIRFGVWMAAGFLIYFLYGLWHSSENPRNTYEDLTSDLGHTPETEHTEMEQLPKSDAPTSKETSKLIKSMFK